MSRVSTNHGELGLNHKCGDKARQCDLLSPALPPGCCRIGKSLPTGALTSHPVCESFFGNRALCEQHSHPTYYSGVLMLGTWAFPMESKSSDERGGFKSISFVAGTSKYFTRHIKRFCKKSVFVSRFLYQNRMLGNDPLVKKKTNPKHNNPCEKLLFEFP